MNAQTHSLGNGARVGGDSTVRRQLDMLAAGQMDRPTFLRATIARLREDPDENWEVLSLLDQYFRLNKIDNDTFRAVKTGLAEFVLRPRGAPAPQNPVPPQTVQISRPAAAVAPQSVAAPPVRPVAASPSAVTQPTEEFRAPPTLTSTPVEPARSARAAPPVSAPQAPAAASIVLETPSIADRDLVAGDVLRGRYRIDGFLGQGGRGVVYAASDSFRLEGQAHGQRVAIKLLQRALARRPDAVLELRREFQLLQSLTHPNIVRVHDFDRDGELSFFTMELLDGVLLTRVALARRQRPLSREHALAVIRDIGAAMSFAHARGVVHGDINPQNIFVTFDGDVRVLDFGAARRTRSATPFIGDDDGRNSFATVGYASPQVMGGENADIRDDIFSLACVAYTLFSGRHPFNEASSLHAQAARVKPKRLKNLKDGPWRALRQALQFERSKRPATVADFLERLDLSQAANRLPNLNDLLESPGVSRSRIPWGAIAAGLVLVSGATYAYLVHEHLLPPPGFMNAPRAARVVAPENDAPEDLAPPPVSTPAPVSMAPAVPATQTLPPARTPSPAPPNAAALQRGTSTARPAPAEATAAAPAPIARTAPPPVSAGPPGVSPRADSALPPAGEATGAGAAPRIATTSRVELVADTVDVTAAEGTARIVVHRRGTLHGEAPFTWWTESGTAKPGIDFEARAAHVDHIPDGVATATLTVNLAQTVRAQPKSFYVVIDQIEGGATVSGRTLTMVTLPGSDSN